jgi:hypothetical protein
MSNRLSDGESLLRDAKNVAVPRRPLALIDIEARHWLDPYGAAHSRADRSAARGAGPGPGPGPETRNSQLVSSRGDK